MKSIFIDSFKKGNPKPVAKKKTSDEVDMTDFMIPEREIRLIDTFLTRFTIVSENSLNEHLDIMLMIKALPNRINNSTLYQQEMFNFRIF